MTDAGAAGAASGFAASQPRITGTAARRQRLGQVLAGSRVGAPGCASIGAPTRAWYRVARLPIKAPRPARKAVAEPDADDDAQEDPDRQRALEQAHLGTGRLLAGHFTPMRIARV